MERSDAWSNRVAGICYMFRRITVVEEFDARGRVKERDSKEHSVRVDGVEQTATLVKPDPVGEPPESRPDERRRPGREREGSARRKVRSSRAEHALSRELIERFAYRLLDTEDREGRRTYVLAFEPRTDRRGGGGVPDRILSRLKGRMWVDVLELEPVRVESSLREPVAIGGFLAVLDEFRIEMVRRRLPSGVWVDERVDTSVGGRKLFQRFRGRMTVTQEEFLPLAETGATAPVLVP